MSDEWIVASYDGESVKAEVWYDDYGGGSCFLRLISKEDYTSWAEKHTLVITSRDDIEEVMDLISNEWLTRN